MVFCVDRGQLCPFFESSLSSLIFSVENLHEYAVSLSRGRCFFGYGLSGSQPILMDLGFWGSWIVRLQLPRCLSRTSVHRVPLFVSVTFRDIPRCEIAGKVFVARFEEMHRKQKFAFHELKDLLDGLDVRRFSWERRTTTERILAKWVQMLLCKCSRQEHRHT